MRVVFDYQIFSAQQYGGISRYFCALASELAKLDDTDARIIAPLHRNSYLRRVDPQLRTGVYVPPWRRTGRAMEALDALVFPPMARRWKPQIIHETYYAANPRGLRPVPRVLTVFDMIHERLPESFAPNDPVRADKARAVRRADAVICISHHTRRELLDIHALPEDRVHVVPLGYDRLEAGVISASDLVGGAPYLLYVGLRSGYKNFRTFARAFAGSASVRERHRIVCFGGGAQTPSEKAELAALGLRDDDVIFRGGPDAHLAALYAGAAAFVYPSIMEGFGIPPLEAMSLSCPVICAGTSSIPEVVGNAAEVFDPTDVQSLSTALERVLGSPDRRAELVRLGLEQCAKFSWARCAEQTRALYAQLT